MRARRQRYGHNAAVAAAAALAGHADCGGACTAVTANAIYGVLRQ